MFKGKKSKTKFIYKTQIRKTTENLEGKIRKFIQATSPDLDSNPFMVQNYLVHSNTQR